MTNRSPAVLVIAFIGLLTGCATVTVSEPDKAHIIPDSVKTKYIKLGQSLYEPKSGNIIEPLYRPHRDVPRRSTSILVWEQQFTSAGETMLTTQTYGSSSTTFSRNKISGEKLPNFPFDIVKHPDSGMLEIRGIKSLVEENGRFNLRWRGLATPPNSIEKPGDRKSEQNEIVEWKILHTHFLHYMPTRQFNGTDELVLKLHAADRTKSRFIKYIITSDLLFQAPFLPQNRE